MTSGTFDLVVIGGGINGCAIAGDAAGRGLKVLLAEMGDLAGGTSSASSRMIHGGLRYLEHTAFRMVREALSERDVLAAKAPHLVRPFRILLPETEGARPRWMIRAGLFLYDHLHRSARIPHSSAIDAATLARAGLRGEFGRGFAYWDCWTDDARLVVLNARAAADHGAEILTRTRVAAATAEGHHWVVRLEAGNHVREVRARALVNAAGPWVGSAGAAIAFPIGAARLRPRLRLVKGSHIVVGRAFSGGEALLLQHTDGRVVFVLPLDDARTMIGTTEVAFTGDPADARCDAAEEAYLLNAVGRYFRSPPGPEEVVWRFAGVRPLIDDASGDASAVTRDYRLDVEASGGGPPLLTVLGGKLTTHRRLAEDALDKLRPHLPQMGPAWTKNKPLPGGGFSGDFDHLVCDLATRYPAPGFERGYLEGLARRYGTLVPEVLGDARSRTDLGADLGAGLTAREVLYLRDREWARTAEDVLWRRTKAGLDLGPAELKATAEAIERLLQTRSK